jgi:hypothetical protein
MMGDQMADWRLILAVGFALFCFGCFYNGLMQRLGESKSGYTAFFVVGGVLITLIGMALIDWRAALLALMLFAASGLPMVIGAMARAIGEREREMNALQEDIRARIEKGYRVET